MLSRQEQVARLVERELEAALGDNRIMVADLPQESEGLWPKVAVTMDVSLWSGTEERFVARYVSPMAQALASVLTNPDRKAVARSRVWLDGDRYAVTYCDGSIPIRLESGETNA